jgi:hypothetical protein
MKDAKRQAEAIAADKRQEETIKNLKEAAEMKKKAAKELTQQLEDIQKVYSLAANVKSEDSAIIRQTINKVNALTAKLKNGATVESVVKELNNLMK